MKDTTTTIDKILEDFAASISPVVVMGQPNKNPYLKPSHLAPAKQAILEWHKDKARSYVLEVIGEDELPVGSSFRGVPAYTRDLLRAEQRAKLDQTLKAIEDDK